MHEQTALKRMEHLCVCAGGGVGGSGGVLFKVRCTKIDKVDILM